MTNAVHTTIRRRFIQISSTKPPKREDEDYECVIVQPLGRGVVLPWGPPGSPVRLLDELALPEVHSSSTLFDSASLELLILALQVSGGGHSLLGATHPHI